jgi:hypothetical protein
MGVLEANSGMLILNFMENIVFYPLEFCDGKYAISECGKVKSVYSISKLGKKRLTGTVLRTSISYRGYETVRLKYGKPGSRIEKTVKVHRLVCAAFHPNPFNKPQVNHKDLNQLNNHKDNLEWATAKENTNHAQFNGRMPIGNPRTKKGRQSQYPNRWKVVIDKITGIEYPSVKHTPLPKGIKWKYFQRMLNGERANKTNYIYKEKINPYYWVHFSCWLFSF